jgi:integrase/recombinase XerD
MATLKLTIDGKRSYSDGRIPIIYRLTHKKHTIRIESGVKVFKQEWDTIKGRINKIHPQSKELNLLLNKRLFELEKKLFEATINLPDKDVKTLKRALIGDERQVISTFFQFATMEIKNLRDQERFGNASVYETSVNRFINYTGKSISFKEINYNVLSGFELTLLKDGICRNTIAIYMRELRALLNLAIKKGLMDRADYPFYNYKIKTERTVCRAITTDELQKIYKHPLKDQSVAWHSRNIFFLIFNLIGISFIDLILLEQESIQNGRIVYRRRKTGKLYSIKITEDAERIINIYRNPDSKYLISYFNFDEVLKSKVREEAGLRIKSCNTQLKKLGKLLNLPIPLTTYVARYTWANVAKSLGYPKDQIAEALGHEYGNRITGIYLDNYGNEVIDEMNLKVTGN